jgi:hypothetical protein
MKLDLAILNVLAASPRAIPATVIRGYLPTFTGEDHTLADINAALTRLEHLGHVKGTANIDTGAKWKETDDGRLRIA